MKKVKDIISFIYPILIEAKTGSVTPYLEVIRYKGKNILNSQTVNYSFGGCHLIFKQLFKEVEIQKKSFVDVLILGMGAGSIISLLVDKYKMDCNITAIEKDQVVIELAEKHFNIGKYASLKIVCADAAAFVANEKIKYDLIISDLFIEGNVPEVFSSNEYLYNIRSILNENGCFIYNKMTESNTHKMELKVLMEKFDLIFPGTIIYKISAFGTENSLLYYNTLPLLVKEEKKVIKFNNKPTVPWPVLKPSFAHGTNKS